MESDRYFYDLREHQIFIKEIDGQKVIIVYYDKKPIKKFLVRNFNISIDAGIVNIHKRKWS